MDILKQLNWRYATKRMNGEKIPSSQLNTLLEAIRLSPSSYGLQPYQVFIVEDKNMKERIALAACQQPQVLESSHLLVFAAWTRIDHTHIERLARLMAAERSQPYEDLSFFVEMVSTALLERDAETHFEWAARQVYLALGVALLAAAELGIDATPMEGFAPHLLDELLGLRTQGLRSTCLLALGYRDSDKDALFKQKKVRRPLDELVFRV